MEITIGDDEGIKLSFSGLCIKFKHVGSALLTVKEARMAADALRMMADHMEASEYGN